MILFVLLSFVMCRLGSITRHLNWGSDFKCVDEDAVRFDLDDLGGEIALLDWGYAGDNEPAVSPPNVRSQCISSWVGQ